MRQSSLEFPGGRGAVCVALVCLSIACAPPAAANQASAPAPVDTSSPDDSAAVADSALESTREASAPRDSVVIVPGSEAEPRPSAGPSTASSSATSIREPQAPPPADDQAPNSVAVALPASAPAELFRLDRGPGAVPLLIPRDETLEFGVHLNLGWLGSPTVGKVTMNSAIRPFFYASAGQAVGEQVLLSGRAEGGYDVYSVENTISAALMPQAFPRLVHRNVQTGTENRIREMKFGLVNGKEITSSRSDGHCRGCKDKAHFVSGTWPWSDAAHCKKCRRGEHRVWRDAKTREIPAGTLDMISAVFLARSLVIDGREKVEFALVDRTDLWMVQLKRGASRTIETPAGKYDAVAVELRTSAPESTDGAMQNESTQFEGLFGIHGVISIWMDAKSGVPVRIEGTVPAGPIDLDATIELTSARGTPRNFAPAR